MSFAARYGPWALVMGASEGTGRELARRIAADGIPSVLVARRAEPLVALAEDIRCESGVECVTATIDLASPDASEAVIAAVGDREIGLLVNNAGADTVGTRFLDSEADAWARLVNLNVTTMMRCCHHFAGPMRKRGCGGLLLVNSGACYGGIRGLAAYAASKAFMLCFAEALWGELNPAGVDVLTLVLGRTDTPAERRRLAELGQAPPAHWASAEDVARVGLERLRHGPVFNWGLADDETGYAISSAAMRRQRVLAIGG